MVWLAWYAGCIAAAFVWLAGSSLGPRLSFCELLSASVPVGTIGGAWLVFIASCIFESLTPTSVVAASVAMGLAALSRLPSFWAEAVRWASAGRRLFSAADGICLLLSLALAYVLWPLYDTRMIPDIDGKIWSGGSCYGDLPIHMQIANSFLHGVNTKVSWAGMMSPIFAGEPMTYPFLPDFHAAIVVALGGTLREGFLIPGFSMVCALWALLFYLGVRLTRSPVGAVFGVLLTIGAGGLGGPRWIAAKGWDEAMSSDVVQHDWTGEWKHLWFAFVPHILLPQRGGTFAYPMSVLVLILVWIATDAQPLPLPRLAHVHPGRPRKLSPWDRGSILRYAGLFAASLPMVQAHAFIGIGVIIGTVAVLDLHKWLADPRLFLGWAQAGIVTLALAGPQMLLFTHTVTDGAYGHFFTYGWLFTKDLYLDFGTPHNIIGFFRFWWHSLGPAIPLFVLSAALYALEALVAACHARRLRASWREKGGIDGQEAVDRWISAARDESYWETVGRGGGQQSSRILADVSAQADGTGVDGDGEGNSPSGMASPLPPALSARSRGHSLSGGPALRKLSMGSDGGGDGRLHSSRAGMAATASGKRAEWVPLGSVFSLLEKVLLNPCERRVAANRFLTAPDRALLPCNALSVAGGRSLDALKFCIGAWLVFLLGNYINFQPWDRDNAKLYYVFIFLASPFSGALLAVPLEAVFGLWGPGAQRLWVWTTLSPTPGQENVRVPGPSALNRAGSSGPALMSPGGGHPAAQMYPTPRIGGRTTSFLRPSLHGAATPSGVATPGGFAAAGMPALNLDAAAGPGGAASRPALGIDGGHGHVSSRPGSRPDSAPGTPGRRLTFGDEPSISSLPPLGGSEGSSSVSGIAGPNAAGLRIRSAVGPLGGAHGGGYGLAAAGSDGDSGSPADATALGGGGARTLLTGSGVAGGGSAGSSPSLAAAGSGVGGGAGGMLGSPRMPRPMSSRLPEAPLSPGVLRGAAAGGLSSSGAPGAFPVPRLRFADDDGGDRGDRGDDPSGKGKGLRVKADDGNGLHSCPPLKPTMIGLGVIGTLASPLVLLLATLSGFMLLAQESRYFHVLFDEDARRMGDWITANVHQKAVVMHSNSHVQPCASLSARASLVAYYGWVSNHGYNANERLGDRDYAMDNAMKDSDAHAYYLLRKWGVRYMMTEYGRRHDRPSEAAYYDARRRAEAGEVGEDGQLVPIPSYDPDLYLDGQLRRVHQEGRFELFEVLGYDFPPG